MSNYRSLLIGCGPRAEQHVIVYPELRNITLVGCCDLLEERRERFQQKYGLRPFADAEQALAELRPEIVHMVTSPGRRVEEAELCARYGVQAMVVEKPMAIKPSDLEGLTRVVEQTGLKIITNCQRRYFPQFRDGTIRDIVANKLGELYLVRASTKGNTMGMGPHTMDLLHQFLGEQQPEQAWAMAHTINEESYQATHLAPESIFAQYWFPGGLRVFYDASPEALGTPGETSFWMHLHFDFLGSKGRLYLTQNGGYWYQTEGMAEPVHGPSSWDEQGFGGQRDFTQAVADWLDGGEPHLNRFELHAPVVRSLLMAQKSVYEGRPVTADEPFTDEQWWALRERLREGVPA
ncbi:MAG: Gfo/Idh/MocA family oxidoreductase [Armatimonadetes bacterium]|nr:Gfo/Idh/MocA family oxidoreductase [Armatimonadota bacterium]